MSLLPTAPAAPAGGRPLSLRALPTVRNFFLFLLTARPLALKPPHPFQRHHGPTSAHLQHRPGRPAQPHKPLQTQRAQLNPSTHNETLSCPNGTQFIQGGIGAPKLGLVVLIKFQIGWRDRRKTFEGSETRKIRFTGMIKLQMCPNLKRQKFS